MTFLSALEHFLLYFTRLVPRADYASARDWSRVHVHTHVIEWNDLNSVLWSAIGALGGGIGGTSVTFAWETRTDETARRIIHNDLSVEQRRLGDYVAILSFSFLTVNCKIPLED